MFPTVSVVIPVYNSERTLEELVTRIRHVLTPITPSFEIVFVNDGSSDQSWKLIQNLSSQHHFVRGFNFSRNYGQQSALLCGVRHASGEITITLDDDLQHLPEEIPRLLAELNQNLDVVYGAPQQAQQTCIRKVASYLLKTSLMIATGIAATEHASAFRCFRSDLKKAFENYDSPFVSLDVLLSWGTSRFGMIRIQHQPRKIGRSGYTFSSLFQLAINMITGYSALPLRIVSILGLSLTFFGILVICFVVGRYIIEGGSVPGFPFLASSIALFSGVQLFALGIIGEYLARMHFRLMTRPAYVVRDVVGLRTQGSVEPQQ